MSDEAPQGTRQNNNAPAKTPVKRPEGGGWASQNWKWLAGAGAAAVVLGGGYFAYKNMSPAQNQTEVAYNDAAYGDGASADGQFGAGSAPAGQGDAAGSAASADDVAAPAEPRRRATRAEPVPEQVIGVGSTEVAYNAVEDESANEIIVRAPRWVRTPSQRRLSLAYPARALERGREGEARIHCTVVNEGALDCERVSETGNSGFGTAALRVARMYRHAPVRADGSSAVGTPVNLRVVFRIADEDTRRG